MNESQFQNYVSEALLIKEVIVGAGGMANKTAVEDALIAKYPDLNRCDAHDVLNNVEFFNLKPPDRRWTEEPAPTIEDWALYLADVRIRWFEGNPFA